MKKADKKERKNAEESKELNDPQFLEKIFLQYKPLMFYIAGQCTKNQDDQDDIVGDVLLKMVEKEDYLKTIDEKAIGTYISAMVRNRAIDFLKEEDRYKEIWRKMDVQLPFAFPSLEERTLEVFRTHELRQAWHRLPVDDQILLEGKYILGLTNKELAAALGCEEDSIRMKLTRARRRAAKILKKAGVDYAQ